MKMLQILIPSFIPSLLLKLLLCLLSASSLGVLFLFAYLSAGLILKSIDYIVFRFLRAKYSIYSLPVNTSNLNLIQMLIKTIPVVVCHENSLKNSTNQNQSLKQGVGMGVVVGIGIGSDSVSPKMTISPHNSSSSSRKQFQSLNSSLTPSFNHNHMAEINSSAKTSSEAMMMSTLMMTQQRSRLFLPGKIYGGGKFTKLSSSLLLLPASARPITASLRREAIQLPPLKT